MTLIWATRGRDWGFRFLLSGGERDPLVAYDAAFGESANDPEVLRHVGDTVALRFPDPLGRVDRSGRVISHSFVLSGADAEDVASVASGRQVVWPVVAEEYARIWDEPDPSVKDPR